MTNGPASPLPPPPFPRAKADVPHALDTVCEILDLPPLTWRLEQVADQAWVDQVRGGGGGRAKYRGQLGGLWGAENERS